MRKTQGQTAVLWSEAIGNKKTVRQTNRQIKMDRQEVKSKVCDQTQEH